VRHGLEFTETLTQGAPLCFRHGLEFAEALLHALLLLRPQSSKLLEALTDERALLGAARAPLAHAFLAPCAPLLVPRKVAVPGTFATRRLCLHRIDQQQAHRYCHKYRKHLYCKQACCKSS